MKMSIAKARNNLSELVRLAKSGKAVELTRRGKPVAVLVGRREYDRLTARSLWFGEAWEKFSHSVDVTDANIDPDEIFREN